MRSHYDIRFSKSENALIRQMAGSGHSPEEMSKRLPCRTPRAVQQYCVRKNIRLAGDDARPAMRRWSAEDYDRLAELTQEGREARDIASAMGRPERDVRAHASRMGLSLRQARRPEAVRMAAEGFLDGDDQLAPQTAILLLDAHGRECRWILGKPRAMMICGVPQAGSSSYCREHRRRALARVC